MSSISGIYIIANKKNGKVYVGQSKNITRRWNTHKMMLVKGVHFNPHLQNAWNLNGMKNFKFQILEYCPIEKLDEREQHYLDVYVPKGICYNIAIDATSGTRGRRLSDEMREKVRLARTGTKLKEETKQKLRDINTGKSLSLEHRRKIGISNTGKVRSMESVEKRTALYRGRKQSQQEIEKRVKLVRKHYEVVSPIGEIMQIVGLKDFCELHGLNANCMSAVAHGRQANHHGWLCHVKDEQ